LSIVLDDASIIRQCTSQTKPAKIYHDMTSFEKKVFRKDTRNKFLEIVKTAKDQLEQHGLKCTDFNVVLETINDYNSTSEIKIELKIK